jgi:anti-sigma factor RsiW
LNPAVALSTTSNAQPIELPMPDEHLTAEQAAAYLDRSLPDPERTMAAAHLARCRACRDEIVALTDVVRPAGSSRTRWRVAAGLAAAAALALVVLPRDRTPPPEPHRAPPGSELQGPMPVLPQGAGPRPASFQWHPFPGSARYQVTLFDTTGGAIARLETQDTAVALPDSVPLAPTRRYYWRVEGADDRGRWIGSDLVPFEVVTPPEDGQ